MPLQPPVPEWGRRLFCTDLLLAALASNTLSSMKNNEAREALAAVDDVERRAAESAPAGRAPVVSIALTGPIAGLAVFFTLQGWPIPTFITCFVLMGVGVRIGTARHRNVRPAMKQEVDTTEGAWSWKRSLGFLLVYSLVYSATFIALQVLPKGNTGVSAAAGAVAAVVWASGLWWGQKRGWIR